MRPENQQALAQRWPSVGSALEQAELPRVQVLRGEHFQTLRIAGRQLESACDPAAEAELQARLVPEGSRQAVVYGVAQGHLVRALLGRPGLENLRVVILSRAVSRASLTFFDHSDWLNDTRVELCLAQPDEELEGPTAVATGCLALADEWGARLRDLLLMELARPHVEEGMQRFSKYREQNLIDNRDLVGRDPSVRQLFGRHPGASISVASAGPTLSDHFDELRASDDVLVALDASFMPLLKAGIVPDYVLTQDCVDYTMRAFFDVQDLGPGDCKLIYFASSASEVVRDWQGERFCASQAPAGTSDALWSSGSVMHPAVDLACQLGAAQVRFYGADFATPRGRSHVSGCSFEIPAPLDPLKPSVPNGHGQKVQSLPNLIGYLRDLERYISRHPEVRFENAGRAGARILGAGYGAPSHAA